MAYLIEHVRGPCDATASQGHQLLRRSIPKLKP
ncbi:hypothetical protein L915_20584 [Phytophthora nicotianae]|nr:hypothetical protein L915_20584 [Phytophthora nicotianae]